MFAMARQPKTQGKGVQRHGSANYAKDRHFTVSCILEITGETYKLKNVYSEMKISALKSYAEFATGIPVHIQRICYLDEGDLLDHTDIKHNDIVPGAVLHMKVWTMWKSLVEAIAANEIDWVFKLGVTQESTYTTPNSEYMNSSHPRVKKAWLADRAFVALYMASHRGHQKLCEKLIASGANVNGKTPLGRSALHVAAARGHGNIVDKLLESGADINAEDDSGETPLTVAASFGNKDVERHLFMFRWQQRAKKTQQEKVELGLFAHQVFDSALPVWLKGPHAQVYFQQLLPPGEFGGTSLSAPRRHRRGGERAESGSGSSGEEVEEEDEVEYEEEEEKVNHQPERNARDLDQTKRVRPGQAGTMPAIKEENRLRRKKTSNSLKSQANQHGDSAGRHPRGSAEKQPGARSQAFSAKTEKAVEKSRSFDDWLKTKKAKDKVKQSAKKQADNRDNLTEEDISAQFFDPERYSFYL